MLFNTERYHFATDVAAQAPVQVTAADARAAVDLVRSAKRAAIVSILQVSAGNARKVWYQLGRLFQELSYGTTDAFGPFYQGDFFKAAMACYAPAPAPTLAPAPASGPPAPAKERFFAMFGDKYCPSAPANNEGGCLSRPGCQYFLHGKGDSVCVENPGKYCREQAQGSVFTSRAAGQPPGCYPVGTPCSQPPAIPEGKGQIDEAGLCKPARQIAFSAESDRLPTVVADPTSFYRALAPAGLADEATYAAVTAARALLALAQRAVAARSCEALRVIKPFWDAEVPLAFNNAAGCYRVLVEPAWDLAYARQSGPDAPLAFVDGEFPRPEVAPLLRYSQADPGFSSWGAI